MHPLLSQSNLTLLSLLLAERGTALGTRGRAAEGALFAPCSFRQPVQKCRDCCCGWEKWGGPELSRGSLTWTGSPTTALCTASSGKLCFMMGMQFCCTFVTTQQQVQEIWGNPSCSILGNLSLNHCMRIHGQDGRGKMRDSFHFSRPPPLHKLEMIKQC